MPVLNISIIAGDKSSKRFEAVVDSGSALCLFHAEIGRALGLEIEDGERDTLGGVVDGSVSDVYYHKIKLRVISETISITAGFSEDLSVAAILGRPRGQGRLRSFLASAPYGHRRRLKSNTPPFRHLRPRLRPCQPAPRLL